MYFETFPQKLRQARKETGYTQQQIQQLIGIQQAVLSSYETGRTQPDIETLGKLCDFYAVSADWLIGTKGANRHPDEIRVDKT